MEGLSSPVNRANHSYFDFAGQQDTLLRPDKEKLDGPVPPGLLFFHSDLRVRSG